MLEFRKLAKKVIQWVGQHTSGIVLKQIRHLMREFFMAVSPTVKLYVNKKIEYKKKCEKLNSQTMNFNMFNNMNKVTTDKPLVFNVRDYLVLIEIDPILDKYQLSLNNLLLTKMNQFIIQSKMNNKNNKNNNNKMNKIQAVSTQSFDSTTPVKKPLSARTKGMSLSIFEVNNITSK